METKERRAALQERLQASPEAVTGTALAQEFGVSRQVIVGDIAILRAAGSRIVATPQGYWIPKENIKQTIQATLVCRHNNTQLAAELFTVVDRGGCVLDVAVEHPLYGELKGALRLSSRRDVERFLHNLGEAQAEPLSLLTGGVHLHTIEVPDRETLQEIEAELARMGILVR